MKRKLFQQKWISLFLIGFCAILTLGLVGCDAIEDLVDDDGDISQEIVGTWVLSKNSEEYSDCPDKNDSETVTDLVEMEFTEAGKFIQRIDMGDGDLLTQEDTYTVSENTLTISTGGEAFALTATIEGSTLRTTRVHDAEVWGGCSSGTVTVTKTYRKK